MVRQLQYSRYKQALAAVIARQTFNLRLKKLPRHYWSALFTYRRELAMIFHSITVRNCHENSRRTVV